MAYQAVADAYKMAEKQNELLHTVLEKQAERRRAADPDAVLNGWQRIEFAPKNGKPILAYVKFDSQWVQAVIRWNDQWEDWQLNGISRSLSDVGLWIDLPEPPQKA